MGRAVLAKIISWLTKSKAAQPAEYGITPEWLPIDQIDATWRSHVGPDAGLTAQLAAGLATDAIIVSPTGLLMDGARRLRAHRALGRREIWGVRVEVAQMLRPDGFMLDEWKDVLGWERLSPADRLAVAERLKNAVGRAPKGRGVKSRDVIADALGTSPTSLRRLKVKVAVPDNVVQLRPPVATPA